MRCALIFLVLAALASTQLSAQSTNGTLATTDPSFNHPGSPMNGSAGGPRHYEAIEFNVTTTGNYSFSYATSGYQGALYMYQGVFLPSSPIVNIWSWGTVTGNPVTEVYNFSVTGKFIAVLTSATNSASGTWTLNVTGPGTLQMGPVVKSVSPTSGSTGGGTALTITGDFFTGVNSVTIGGASVTGLTVVNSTTITCTSPAGTAGAADIVANNPAGFGLQGTLAAGYTYVSTPTTVSSINRQTPAATTTNQASVVFRVTFAASVAGVSTSNFTLSVTGVTGASVTSVSGSGTTRDVTVNTGSGNGTIRLDMANATGVTPGLTNVPFTTGQSYTIDKTAPVVSSIVRAGANPTNATSVTFTVTFSESVTGLAAGNFAVDQTGLTGASVGTLSGSGASYSITANTGTGSGSLSVDLINSIASIVDSAGNSMASAFVAGEVYTIDKVAPTVSSIVRAGANPTNAASVSFTVTFSETVTGVATGNFNLTTTGVAGATVSSVTGSGSTRTVNVNTGTGSGTIQLNLSSVTPAIPDTAGNNLAATFNSGEVYTIDKAAPTVTSITRGGASPTNATSVSYTVNFSESVTGVATGNFTLTTTGVAGASVTSVSGSGTSRTVTVNTGSGSGTIRLDLTVFTPAIADAAANNLAAAFNSGEVYTVDKTAPTVNSILRAAANPTAAASVTFNVTFSESVTGVATGNFTLSVTGVSGASVSSVSGAGTAWTVTVNTGTGSGTIRLDLTSFTPSISDGVGNTLSTAFASGEVYTVDKTAPTVLSIVRASTNPTNASSVAYTVTFSESVTGVAAGNFSITASGVSGASVASVTGSGTTRTVNVNTGTGDGTLRLDLSSLTPAISDALGNTLGATFNTGEVYTVDKTAPTVTSIVRANPNPTNAASVSFTVTFSESVTGAAVGNFSISATGVTGASVTSVTGTGTTRSVTISTGSGDGSLRLDLTVFTPAISDAVGNSVSAAFTTGESYTVDKTAPTVVSVVRASSNPTSASSVNYTVTFSETVTGPAAGNFTLTLTGLSGAAVASVTGSGTTRTVNVTTGSGDGTIRLDLTVFTPAITDALGNALSAAFTTGEIYTIDKTGPTISIGAPSVSTTVSGPVDYVVTYSGADSVTLSTADITLNNTGSAAGSVSVLGSGLTSRTVRVSGISGNGTLSITIAAGTATDAALNGAPGAGPSTTFTVISVPTIVIGVPSVSVTSGGPVSFDISYSNATAITLTAGDVTVNGIGGVTGSVAVSGTGLTNRTVTVSSITGTGSFSISLAAGTASNPQGSAGSAGPSSSVQVDNTAPLITALTPITIVAGASQTGVPVATVSDNLTAAGSVSVSATTVPAGLSVTNVTNTGGNVTADIAAAAGMTPGTLQIVFTATDGQALQSTANFGVTVNANTPPTITAIADLTIAMNGNTGAITFTVGDAEDGANPLLLSFTTDNAILITAPSVVFGGMGSSRDVTVTPATDNAGVATIVVTVTDTLGSTASETFVLTVQDTTLAPFIAPIADVVMPGNSTSPAIAITVSDPQGVTGFAAPVVTSANAVLVTGAGIAVSGSAPGYTLRLTPVVGQTGTSVMLVSVTDGTHTFSRTFNLIVTSPKSEDDDEGCSTGEGQSWLMLAGLLAALGVALRLRKARA